MAVLPILPTVRRAYDFVREHVGAVGPLSAVWLGAAAIAFVVSWLLLKAAGEPEDLREGERIGALIALSVWIIGISVYVIIVKWHRLIIQGATPPQTRHRAMSAGFLYFARGMLIGTIGVFTVVLVGLLPPTLLRELDLPADVRGWLSPVFVSIAFVAALIVVARLSLVLPAAAVGDFSMTLRKSWDTTRGSSWPILAGSALTSGPSIAANIAFNGVAEWVPQASGSAAVIVGAMVLSMGLAILTAVFEASFLSYAYLFFTGERTPAIPSEG